MAIAIPDDPERARAIIGRGRRIARYLGLEWIALSVVRRTESRSSELEELVAALGGRLLLAEAEDIATALVELSCREQARLLVIGRSQRPRILRRFLRGTTERIVIAKRPFDVVVAGGGAER